MESNKMIMLFPAVFALLLGVCVLALIIWLVSRLLRSRNRGIFLGVGFGLFGLFILAALFTVRVGAVRTVRSTQLINGYNSYPSQMQPSGVDISAEEQRIEVRKGGKRIVVSPEGMSIIDGDGNGSRIDMPGMSLSTSSGTERTSISSSGALRAKASSENREEPLIAQLYERGVELATSRPAGAQAAASQMPMGLFERFLAQAASQPSESPKQMKALEEAIRATMERAKGTLLSEPERGDVREKLQRLEVVERKVREALARSAEAGKKLEMARLNLDKVRADTAEATGGGVTGVETMPASPTRGGVMGSESTPVRPTSGVQTGAEAVLQRAQLMLELEQKRAAETHQMLARCLQETEAALRSLGTTGTGTVGVVPPAPAAPVARVTPPTPPAAVTPPAPPAAVTAPKVYPTRISAALGLAKSMLRNQLAHAECTLRAVSISGDDPIVVSEMVRRLPKEAEGIAGWGHPNVTSTVGSSIIGSIAQSQAPASDELRLYVAVNVAPGGDVDQGGRVDVILRSSDGSMSSSSPYGDASLAPPPPIVYRTRISAALGMAKNMLREYLAAGKPAVRVVSISGDDPAVVSEMVRRLPMEAKGIGGWDRPKVVRAPQGSTGAISENGEIRMHVTVTVPPGGDVDAGGRVDLTMRSGDGEVSSSAQYSDKPPVPAAMVPGVVARSSGPSAPGAVVGQPWTPSDQHPFQPNIYPTRISAALGMAKRMLRDYLGTIGTLSLVSISGDDPAVVSEMVRRLPMEATNIPGWGCPNVILAPAGMAATPLKGEIRFQVAVHVNPGMTVDQGGRVDLTMRTSSSEATYSAEYVDGRWSEEFQKWQQQHPGHSWILATSEQLCMSERAAIEQARLAAAKEVAKRVERYIREQGGVYRYDSAELERRISEELRDGGIPVQQFTQQFQRPYGDVWRCAMLIDASPASLERIAAKYCGEMRRVRAHWANVLLSALGLLLVIVGVYLLLNAATRGYYVWSIRVMLLVVLGAGVWFVLKF